MTLENASAFDENAFRKLLGSDDASLLSPLFDRAFNSIREFMSDQTTDHTQLEFDAHKLKTTCTQLGANRLANVLSSLEQAASQGDAARSEALKRILKSEFIQVESALKTYSKKLQASAKSSS